MSSGRAKAFQCIIVELAHHIETHGGREEQREGKQPVHSRCNSFGKALSVYEDDRAAICAV